jgi:cysteine desulfurase/selenocysteine lyase
VPLAIASWNWILWKIVVPYGTIEEILMIVVGDHLMIDLNRVRNETTGVTYSVYLQNAGSALPPMLVPETIKKHLDLEAEIGGYEAANREVKKLQGVYTSIARLINARTSEEIAITNSATAAWQMAFYSYALSFEPGDHILTSAAEYAANYVAFLQIAKRAGIIIDVVPNDASGQLDVRALERMITKRSKLIAITWIPTNGGLVNPAVEIGKVARAQNIPYLLDACQAVGQLPVDVEELGCDMLSATGRKFLRGPRGTGFLYVRETVLNSLEPIIIDHFAAPWVACDRYDVRPDAKRFETWEKNYALHLGLGAAVDYALDIGITPIAARCRALSTRLRDGLRSIPDVTIRDLGISPSAIVSFTIKGHDAQAVVVNAGKKGIKIGVSNPSSTRLDAEARSLPPVIRAAPHYYNTEAEVDALIEHCLQLVATS